MPAQALPFVICQRLENAGREGRFDRQRPANRLDTLGGSGPHDQNGHSGPDEGLGNSPPVRPDKLGQSFVDRSFLRSFQLVNHDNHHRPARFDAIPHGPQQLHKVLLRFLPIIFKAAIQSIQSHRGAGRPRMLPHPLQQAYRRRRCAARLPLRLAPQSRG